MKRCLLALALSSLTVLFGRAENDDAGSRGAWRLSVGGSVIGGIRSQLGVKSSRLVNMSGFGLTVGRLTGADGRSKADAYALGSGEANNGKRIFDGGAWYDPADSGANDSEWSWNWRLHDPDRLDPDGKRGFIERTSYAEEAETLQRAVYGEGATVGDSTDWMPGLRLELSRELYASEGERRWGVDLAVAFSYYFQRDIWKASGTAATASSQGERTEGYYEWWNNSQDEAQYILDWYRDSQFSGGMWGMGGFDTPGAELFDNGWNVRDVVTHAESWSESHTLRYQGSGSYREYSIEALARPWWEPWDWLRVFGSLGVEISRREFEWSFAANGTDGSRYCESGTEADWRAFGLFGGGISAQWRGAFITGEALWRFGGDDLDVQGRAVNGEITHGDWGFRLSLGYEF